MLSKSQIEEINECVITKVIELLRPKFLENEIDLENLRELEDSWRKKIDISKPSIDVVLPSKNDVFFFEPVKQISQMPKYVYPDKVLSGYKLYSKAALQNSRSYLRLIPKTIRRLSFKEVAYLEKTIPNFGSSNMYIRRKINKCSSSQQLSERQNDGAVSDISDFEDDYDEELSDEEKHDNNEKECNSFEGHEIDGIEKSNLIVDDIKKKKTDDDDELEQNYYSDNSDDTFIDVELSQDSLQFDDNGPSKNGNCSDISLDSNEIFKIDQEIDQPSESSSGEEPNSDDDEEDADPNWADCDDVICSTSVKISKRKKNYTIILKNGLINIKGKDYVFSTLQGKARWE